MSFSTKGLRVLLNTNTFILMLKGFAMGAADIVPGVSGGTIAFITGIYDELVETISKVDTRVFSLLMQRRFKHLVDYLNAPFIIPLFIGIFMAIISLARVIHFFLDVYPQATWSLFFGLILSSVLFIAKKIENLMTFKSLFSIVLGIFIGYLTVSLVPVQTANSGAMIFFSGAIAICAMILPGISGSFILLILGKYAFITSALKNPFSLESLQVILVFSIGCLLGLISFSKILNFLLKHYHNIMMAILSGFMIGSLKKIWPWKEVLETKIIRGKTYILSEMNVLPQQFDQYFFLCLFIFLIGFFSVILLEKFSSRGVSSAG